MSAHATGNVAHDNACNKLEAVRQAAVPGMTQTQIIAAEITYYRSCYKQCVADGVSPSLYLDALRSLGVPS